MLAFALVVFGCARSPQKAYPGVARHSAPALLVVLGSSTAAGTGPAHLREAWVPRYTTYLQQRFPDFSLVNLAVSGQNSYQIQASDFAPPGNRPRPVAGKNISAALALHPNAIIVNMPSNDTAENFSVAEQLANFERVVALATTAHVMVWLTSTQPRNFTNEAQLTTLKQVRDALFHDYAPRTLDFWTPFANADGTIKPSFSAGDGIHLNAAAHSVLEDTVIAAHIPEAALARAN